MEETVEELKKVLGLNCLGIATRVRQELGLSMPIDEIALIVATFKVLQEQGEKELKLKELKRLERS